MSDQIFSQEVYLIWGARPGVGNKSFFRVDWTNVDHSVLVTTLTALSYTTWLATYEPRKKSKKIRKK